MSKYYNSTKGRILTLRSWFVIQNSQPWDKLANNIKKISEENQTKLKLSGKKKNTSYCLI